MSHPRKKFELDQSHYENGHSRKRPRHHAQSNHPKISKLEILEQKLPRCNSINSCLDIIIDLGVDHKETELPKEVVSRTRILISQVISKLNEILHSQVNRETWEKVSPTRLSFFVYNLKIMVKFYELDLMPALNLLLFYYIKMKSIPKEIAEAIYTISKLVKTTTINQTFNVGYIHTLLGLMIKNEDFAYPLDIAKMIYALGVFSRAEMFEKSLKSELLNTLLDILQSTMQPLQSQLISMTIYGLGSLAKVDNLDDVIECEHLNEQTYNGRGSIAKVDRLDDVIVCEYLNDLTYKLSKLKPLGSQHISNTIYGLGSLAKAKKLDAKIEAKNLNELIYLLSKIEEDMSAQHISNTIYGLGNLAEAGNLDEDIETKTLNKLLEKLLLLESTMDSQHVSDVIYGLGKLALAKRLDNRYFINVETINKLIDKQLAMDHIGAQDISKTMYGLGQLAKYDMFDNLIDGRNVIELIKIIAQFRSINSRSISLTLNGAGNLAKAGKLDHTIPGKFINTLLENLHLSKHLDAISICSSIYGLGDLAKAHLVDGPIKTKHLKILLRDLSQANRLDPRAISNAIYGSDELAKVGLLDKPIYSECINILLQKLTMMHISEAQHISNTLYGICILAKTYVLKSKVSAENLNRFMEQLFNIKDKTSQDISMSIYGLGMTANAGLLKGILSSEWINKLINDLAKLTNLSTHSISNVIIGLGELAKGGSLDGPIDFDALSFMLALLPGTPGLNALEVAITIYGLDKLVVARKIVVPGEQVDNFSQSIANMLQKSFPFDLSDAATILTGIGNLTQTGVIKSAVSLPTERIVQFTQIFQEQFLHPIRAAKIIHALIIINNVDPRPELYTCLMSVLPHLSGVDCLEQDLKDNLYNDLKTLEQYSPTWFHALNEKMNPDVNPISAALPTTTDSNQSETYIDIALNNNVLPTESEEPTNNSTTIIQRPDPNINSVNRRNITPVISRPRPRITSLVSSTAPSSGPQTLPCSAFWQEAATNNDIFRLIATRDLLNLKRLLGTELQDCQSTYRAGRQNRQDQTTTKKYAAPTNAAQLVKAFLRRDVRALRELANVTPQQYFTELLYACTLHERLSIIKEYLFYPILTSLSISELNTFIKRLISPLQIYRDHVALLRIVDGLMIRFGQSRDLGERTTIKRLQNLLLIVGIEFHQKHKHVKPRLERVQDSLITNTLSFIDHEDSDVSVNFDIEPTATESNLMEEQTRYNLSATNSTTQISFALSSANATPALPAVAEREENATQALSNVVPTKDQSNQTESLIQIAETTVTRPLVSPTRSSSSFHSAPSHQASQNINIKYCYTDNDIYNILDCRFHDAICTGRIEIVPPSTLIEDQSLQSRLDQNGSSTLENMLKNYLEVNSRSNTSRTILVPIESGGHWIGLNIKMQNNIIQRIVYYNNSLNPDSQNHHLNLLKKPLQKVFEELNLEYPHARVDGQKKIQILTNMNQIKTSDNENCGPLLIHNFYMDIVKQKYDGNVDDNFIRKLRLKHADLLKRSNTHYYQEFVARQYTSTNIQPISSQLRRSRAVG